MICIQVNVKDAKVQEKLQELMPDYGKAMNKIQKERRLYKEASAIIKIREGQGRDGIRHFKNAAVKLAVQNLGFLRAFVLFTTLKPEDISFAFIWSHPPPSRDSLRNGNDSQQESQPGENNV